MATKTGFLFVVLLVVWGNVAAEANEDDGKRVLIDAPVSPDFVDPYGRGKAPPPSNPRVRRDATACGSTAATVTQAQKDECVIAHNLLRGKERATNELKMEWDDGLASLSQSWANQCKFEHGMLYDCNGDRVGQNLFLMGGTGGSYPSVNFTYAIVTWNDERNYWDFSTQKCQSGKVCGHWSQVVGAKSRKVGCAHSLCPSIAVSSGTWNNALLVVCDYSPAGNVVGEAVFLPGPPCTACTTVTGSLSYRGYKCQNNLCVPCLPKDDTDCQCGEALTCLNGGAYSSATCVCQCPSGFYGATCEHTCACTDVYGSSCLQWTQFCADPMYLAFMTANCAKTCDLCNIPDSCLA